MKDKQGLGPLCSTVLKGEIVKLNRIFRAGRAPVLIVLGLLLGACSVGPVMVAPEVPPTYTKLGPAEGKACGTLALGPTAYNAIPVKLNDRAERAYENAVSSVAGATALMDVSYQESWFWWVIGTTRCVTVSGEAIQ